MVETSLDGRESVAHSTLRERVPAGTALPADGSDGLVAFVYGTTMFKAELRSSLMAQDGRPDTPPGQGRRRVDRTRAYKLNLYGSPLRIRFCGSRKCFHGHGKAPRQHRGESTSRAPKAHAAQAINCRCSGVVAVMRGDGERV